MRQEIGGMRLGSGNKLSVEMHSYPRSNHDLGYIWRSSMAAGTLIPFLSQVALPGDTWDIDLQAVTLTHPTLGPAFAGLKLQLDVFEAPFRLYHPALMQNTIGIGNNMQNVILPKIRIQNLPALTFTGGNNVNPDNLQINPSALMRYLGVAGWGNNLVGGVNNRKLLGINHLAYWEIYKNYYANKQETNGQYLLAPTNSSTNITSITVGGPTLPQNVNNGNLPANSTTGITINYGAGTAPLLSQIIFTLAGGTKLSATQLCSWTGGAAGPSTWVAVNATIPSTILEGWAYALPGLIPVITTFPLTNIDGMKSLIMQLNPAVEFIIDNTANAPYGPSIDIANTTGSQCGLALKTYQSDLFNNWINTTTFNSITTGTQVSTAGNVFTIDSLVLARKVWALGNRIAITDGTYNAWLTATYGESPLDRCYSPIYHGGLSKEVTFQEVVSTAGVATQSSGTITQPLGTLAGKGKMTNKHKGGHVRIRVTEPAYIIGIVSLTPRLDYSQGNNWDTYAISTMNDLHKPAMDQIGFQDLITEQMAWFDTTSTVAGTWVQHAAGKQPAWENYMTSVNKCYGTFADQNNEMFMTFNRRYQAGAAGTITDLTTYIDPAHFNFIFAQTSLDSQNYWTQIAVDITVRRAMSEKLMPNL